MATAIELKATAREALGSSMARRLRRDGLLPGVTSNEHGVSRSVQMNLHDFEMMLQHHASENLIMDLAIGEEAPVKALVKEIQRNPLNGHVVHVDFVEVSMTRRITVRIPVELKGEAAGVTEGGTLEHLLRDLEVECLPTDLVEQFDVDVSQLAIGDSLQVDDLNIDAKFTVMTGGDVAVAMVAAPRVEEEVVEEEAEEVAGEEPEVIGKKEEGEESEKEGTSD